MNLKLKTMCFVTTESVKAKIAKNDIKCWKVLFPRLGGNKYESPVESFHYHPGRKTKKVILNKVNSRIINEGYHSYITKKDAENSSLMCGSKEIYKMIIPKGTRYFSNSTEYVSETIILVQ